MPRIVERPRPGSTARPQPGTLKTSIFELPASPRCSPSRQTGRDGFSEAKTSMARHPSTRPQTPAFMDHEHVKCTES